MLEHIKSAKIPADWHELACEALMTTLNEYNKPTLERNLAFALWYRESVYRRREKCFDEGELKYADLIEYYAACMVLHARTFSRHFERMNLDYIKKRARML